MKNNLNELVKNELKEMNVFIDDVFSEEENNQNYLRIVIDREGDYINLEEITKISELLNKVIDEKDLAEDNQIVDVYTKTKGDIDER